MLGLSFLASIPTPPISLDPPLQRRQKQHSQQHMHANVFSMRIHPVVTDKNERYNQLDWVQLTLILRKYYFKLRMLYVQDFSFFLSTPVHPLYHPVNTNFFSFFPSFSLSLPSPPPRISSNTLLCSHIPRIFFCCATLPHAARRTPHTSDPLSTPLSSPSFRLRRPPSSLWLGRRDHQSV